MALARVAAAHPSAEVAFVYDPNPELLRAAVEETGATAISSFTELCAAAEAIIVATPPALHAACAIEALRAGKHVLSEVPAVVSLDEARSLYAETQASSAVYMIAENVCYFPVVQTARRLVREGALGEVLFAEGEYVHDCRPLLYDRQDGMGGGTHEVASWRGDFAPIRYSTHEIGPMLMITGQRIVQAQCVEARFPRSEQRQPSSGPILLQSALFTTETGAAARELVAFQVSREPAHHFLSFYGTHGSLETDRYRWTEALRLYSDVPGTRKTDALHEVPIDEPDTGLPPEATRGGHGRSEYFMLGDFLQAVRSPASPSAGLDLLGIRAALNMSVPGICAALSVQRNGAAVEVPTW